MDIERRRKRSSDPLVALHYQFTELRKEGGFDAIVLTDSTGMVVAGAGPWAACEELAAYAPLFAQDGGEESSRMETLRPQVQVRPVNVGGAEVILCSRRPPGTSEATPSGKIMDQAEAGVSRILAA